MDFFEPSPTHILFIPGIFIEDCDELTEDIQIYPNNGDSPRTKNETQKIGEEDLEDLEQDSDVESAEGSDQELEGEELTLGEFLEERRNNGITHKNYVSPPTFFVDAQTWIKSTNLLCCFCHGDILGTPFPIGLNKIKKLVPQDEEQRETFISLISEKNFAEPECSDDHLLFSCQLMKEISLYPIHYILGCSISHIVSYIRKVEDPKIKNKRESVLLSIDIYRQITGKDVKVIPESDLWINMEQYSGTRRGVSREKYNEKLRAELSVKAEV